MIRGQTCSVDLEEAELCFRAQDDRQRRDILCREIGQRHRPLPLLSLPLRPHRPPALHGGAHAGLHPGLRSQTGDYFLLRIFMALSDVFI